MSASSGFGYGSVSCCDAKVDPISLLTAIGAIAAVSLFLRQAVIDNMIAPPRKKKRSIGSQRLEVQTPYSYGINFHKLGYSYGIDFHKFK